MAFVLLPSHLNHSFINRIFQNWRELFRHPIELVFILYYNWLFVWLTIFIWNRWLNIGNRSNWPILSTIDKGRRFINKMCVVVFKRSAERNFGSVWHWYKRLWIIFSTNALKGIFRRRIYFEFLTNKLPKVRSWVKYILICVSCFCYIYELYMLCQPMRFW